MSELIERLEKAGLSHIAPMPDCEMIRACAQIGVQTLPENIRLGAWAAAEIAARHAFLQGWYLGHETALKSRDKRVRAEIKRAIAADSELSLRECARKYGVGVGVVRGVRAQTQPPQPTGPTQ